MPQGKIVKFKDEPITEDNIQGAFVPLENGDAMIYTKGDIAIHYHIGEMQLTACGLELSDMITVNHSKSITCEKCKEMLS